MARVVIFGGGLQTLSISRGLKEYGHTIYNVADKDAIGNYGHYIDCFFSIDLKKYDVSSFIDFISQNDIDIVIPTEDEYAEWLSIKRSQILERIKVELATVEESQFKRVIDKGSLLALCNKFNIPHPKTVGLNLRNLRDVGNRLEFPLLIKPNISNGARGICRVNTLEDLMVKAPQILEKYGECSLQEFIQNNHYYNVMLYRYADGSWGPEVATRITRFYPVKGGSSSFCTTIQNDQLIAPCKKLLEKLNWTGFADFDVLEKDQGDFRIIEINPRVPASVHAAYISGVNYGQIIIEDLLNHNKLPMTYLPGKQLRFLGLDIAWFISSSNRFRATPSWFKFFGKNLYYQEGGLKDWRAMLYSIYSGVKKQLSPSFRKAKSGMN